MPRTAFFAIAISIVGSLALGHGGGLDSLGCHSDRKAGIYHCHKGKLAGQNFANKEKALSRAAQAEAESTPFQEKPDATEERPAPARHRVDPNRGCQGAR